MGPGKTSVGSGPGLGPEVLAVSLTFDSAVPVTPSHPPLPGQEPWVPILLQTQKTESKSHPELCPSLPVPQLVS